MRKFWAVLLLGFLSPFFCINANAAKDSVQYLIGQDVTSIDDFFAAIKSSPSDKKFPSPTGIMTYTAINDLRGLAEPVDHGAGVNNANDLLSKYPQLEIVQIGLYMKYMLKEVVAGNLDDNISRLGLWIKDSGKQVYLRIGYEFDNPDNEYDPDLYIKAYQRIVDRFREMNIENVHFVWHTIAWRDKTWPVYKPLSWYPGDDYVDVIGISFFDHKQSQERNVIAKIARDKHKPLIIAESSPFKQTTVESKLEWMNGLFKFVQMNKVALISYINVNWDALPLFAQEKWGDARLQHSPVLMQEWQRHLSLE